VRASPDGTLLEVQDLMVRFGGLRALDGVSLIVPDSGIVGLIGPNGAGKTTLIDAVTGFVPIAEGSIRFAGAPLTNLSAHRRAQCKLSRTFQSLELFEDLTVAENVQVPIEAALWWRNIAGMVRKEHACRPEVDWALQQLELDGLASASPDELSQAQRKHLALARAIVTRPRLLLLDEPAAGLDETGTKELGRRLRRLAGEGMSLLLVDHDMALVLEICDQVCVLDSGRVIATGSPREIRRDPEVLRAYLGEDESAADAPTELP
jgi:branched-chain amino acid transport system ATP-binding protein